MIVHSETMIVRERQLAIRRELDRRGISLKVIAFDSGIKYGTLLTYFPRDDIEPHALSLAALNCLVGHMPADLLDLLLPTGWLIMRVPEGCDHDDAEAAMLDYMRAKQEAHHPTSPAGREIAPCEDQTPKSLRPSSPSGTTMNPVVPRPLN